MWEPPGSSGSHRFPAMLPRDHFILILKRPNICGPKQVFLAHDSQKAVIELEGHDGLQKSVSRISPTEAGRWDITTFIILPHCMGVMCSRTGCCKPNPSDFTETVAPVQTQPKTPYHNRDPGAGKPAKAANLSGKIESRITQHCISLCHDFYHRCCLRSTWPSITQAGK